MSIISHGRLTGSGRKQRVISIVARVFSRTRDCPRLEFVLGSGLAATRFLQPWTSDVRQTWTNRRGGGVSDDEH